MGSGWLRFILTFSPMTRTAQNQHSFGSQSEGALAPNEAQVTGVAEAPSRTERIARTHYREGDLVAGKYELIKLLGEGGMGSVWRARNADLDADVALKLIRVDAVLSGAGDRLLREAQAAAKLADPAIIRVFDFGKSEAGDPFIVMELLDGEDLNSAIRSRGFLSAKRAVRVMLPVIRALAVAHQHGIVHRDLKPENIFLVKNRGGLQPKVLDFGIAQLDEGAALRLTSTGALLGSPLYMSPEQAKGESVDFRADIWSLSVVLFEALTGDVPFPGNNYNAVLCALLVKPLERPGGDRAIDDELWSILARGLDKEPAYRFESMQEYGKALAGWLLDQGEQEDITGASLRAQWLSHESQIDQLTTLFPGRPDQQTGYDRRAPTQRISRPSRIETPSAVASGGPKRGWFVALGAALLVLGALLGWAMLRAAESSVASEALHPKPATPVPLTRPVEPRVGAAATAPAPVEDTKPAPAPTIESTSAVAEPARAAKIPRAHSKPATTKAVRKKRTSKLKNPFAQ